MADDRMDDFRGWTLGEWRERQLDGRGLERLEALLASLEDDDTAWISRLSTDGLSARWQALEARRAAGEQLSLFGVPFAVKDNIDVAGFDTTAACPEFAYAPSEDAEVIARLQAQGAIAIGKTNLDQFATGLVGTRSPYGAVTNAFDPRYVSGGSSAGSASVVARGLVPFSLGTDTAGSGRVPAGFNNIVGLKPTRGWFSNRGLVPACRTLDCISIFALTAEDAETVAEIAGGYDPQDPYSRRHPGTAPVALPIAPRLGIPDKLEFFGDTQAEAAFAAAISRLEALGAELVEIDYAPFAKLAAELYQGPWVAERTAAVEALLETDSDAIEPTVRGIVQEGFTYSALDVFKAEYRRAELSRTIGQVLNDLDALVVPTSPTIRTIAEMAEQPVAYNAQFGTYTNFTNLADLSALALPADFRSDGLPAGITLIAPAWHDRALTHFARRWQQALAAPLGATGRPAPGVAKVEQAAGCVRVAVVGAHLTGMPLNFQLITRDARLVEQTLTAPRYRLYALAGTVPPKPGLARCADGEEGCAIIVELWDVPTARFGEFVAEIPAPLGIGNLELEDGRWVKGFICEGAALPSARDITAYGGWRAFIADPNR
ncbi:allophanate hydrolase [Halotalea alkalilenta]|nr:allophanate hydrolase [Halotalea alkalilenta]